MTYECTVNDIDGNAVQTIDDGPLAEVMSRADDRLRLQIKRAVASDDGIDQESFDRDGESYTVRVIVR